ncbi:MFS transporter [Enterococcus hirae]|nr:MFS transporter [Enterococcus hirae]EMF0221714.1 MFS transporter [Enterococcus hirae]
MQQTRISVKEKIGFALTNLGNIPVMTLLNTYLLIFYTDVIGINPAVVSTLFLVSRLLDGFSDPLLGFLIDRFPVTRFGKYRPILVLGTVICCINYLLVWFAPLLFTSQKIVVIYISYILLGITFDLMDIPLNSLIPVLTDQEADRNILSSIKGVSYTVGPTCLNILAPLILSAYNNGLSGYTLLIVGTVLVVLFFTIFGTLALKERGNEEPAELSQERGYSYKEALAILKIRPVMTLFISMLFITAASNIFSGSLLYYLNYILNDTKLLSFASFLGLFGALGAGVLVPSLSADNVDQIKHELGIETAALIASLNSFIMKFAMAIGGAIPGFVLSYTGYVANQAQLSSASFGIIFSTFVVPLVFYLITLGVFQIGYPANYLFVTTKEKPSIG